MKVCCKDCEYLQKKDPAGGGQCWLNPPVPMVYVLPSLEQPYWDNACPYMGPDEWCGHAKRKESY